MWYGTNALNMIYINPKNYILEKFFDVFLLRQKILEIQNFSNTFLSHIINNSKTGQSNEIINIKLRNVFFNKFVKNQKKNKAMELSY